MTIYRARLENRAVVKVTGAEYEDFLQNLVTQDVTRACPQAAALLTPQGKLAHDFIIQPANDGLLIDCAAESTEPFVKKLTLYKLRREVEITLTDLPVEVVWSDAPDAQNLKIENFFADPRTARLGLRCLGASPADLSDFTSSTAENWAKFRLSLGVPEGPTEMPPGTVFPMEFGFERMGAIDFQKGCFIGQEVTSRVHRKGSLRKTLHPAVFETPMPPVGTPIINKDRKVGEIVAALDGHALVLLRTDALTASMRADGRTFKLQPGLF